MLLAYTMILWDWNGTLLDDADYGSAIVNGMLRRRGLRELSRMEHARLFDFPVVRYYERVGFDFAKEPFEVLSHEFIEAYYASVKNCSLHPGTREVLASLQAAGYRQGVLSASRQDYLEDQIHHFGLEDYFDALLGIDSVHAPGKTGRGQEWIHETGFPPAQVLLVGDTVHDAEVAQAMGIDCWLVNQGHHPPERLLETGRPCHDNLDQVAKALLSHQLERTGA